MTIPSHTELAALARTLAYDCEADSISHALADRIAVVLNACAAALASPERVQGEARGSFMSRESAIAFLKRRHPDREPTERAIEATIDAYSALFGDLVPAPTPPTAPAQDAQQWRENMQAKRAAADAHDATPSPQAATAGAMEALRGLLEIEEARIATGAFTPNAEATKRIEAARAAIRASTPAQQVPLTDEQRAKLLEAADHLSGDGHFMDAADADWAADWLRGIVTKESST